MFFTNFDLKIYNLFIKSNIISGLFLKPSNYSNEFYKFEEYARPYNLAINYAPKCLYGYIYKLSVRFEAYLI
jgi:hypothetical protein